MSESKKKVIKKQNLDELVSSKSELRSILDNVSHAFITTEVDGTITSFNRKAIEMLGYKEEELVGKENPDMLQCL